VKLYHEEIFIKDHEKFPSSVKLNHKKSELILVKGKLFIDLPWFIFGEEIIMNYLIP
jgi:hypothetical protein